MGTFFIRYSRKFVIALIVIIEFDCICFWSVSRVARLGNLLPKWRQNVIRGDCKKLKIAPFLGDKKGDMWL